MTDFSYQLYSSRNFPPLEQTLKMLAEAGYKKVEGVAGMIVGHQDPAWLRTQLDMNGLAMPSMHVGLDMLEDDPAQVVSLARTLGVKAIVVPYLVAEERPIDKAGWHALGERVERAGAPMRDAGLTVAWHNHDFEFRPLPDGTLPIDVLLEGGKDLKLELDLAWVKVAGHDPVDFIRKYGDRLIAVHVKDVAPAGECSDEDGWADVGHGVMNWPPIAAVVPDSASCHLVMEHDNPNDHKRFAERSIQSARQIWSA